jgi:hypothetical protein
MSATPEDISINWYRVGKTIRVNVTTRWEGYAWGYVDVGCDPEVLALRLGMKLADEQIAKGIPRDDSEKWRFFQEGLLQDLDPDGDSFKKDR